VLEVAQIMKQTLRLRTAGCGFVRECSERIDVRNVGFHLNWIPWTAQRRRIAEVEITDFFDGHPVMDCRGENVYAFGDFCSVMTNNLRPQNTTRSPIASDAATQAWTFNRNAANGHGRIDAT
jgi:hypothetical protein